MKRRPLEIKLRNELIARRYFLTDESSAEIAKDYKLTRQRVFAIAKKYSLKYGYPKENNETK